MSTCDCGMNPEYMREGANPHASWCREAKSWTDAQRLKRIVAATRYEGHADTLPYGWWEMKAGRRVLPRTLGDPKNFTLRLEELVELHQVLTVHHEWLNKARGDVRTTIKAIETGYHSEMLSGHDHLICYTIAHALELLLNVGKFKLAMMQWMVKVSGRRVEEKKAE